MKLGRFWNIHFWLIYYPSEQYPMKVEKYNLGFWLEINSFVFEISLVYDLLRPFKSRSFFCHTRYSIDNSHCCILVRKYATIANTFMSKLYF